MSKLAASAVLAGFGNVSRNQAHNQRRFLPSQKHQLIRPVRLCVLRGLEIEKPKHFTHDETHLCTSKSATQINMHSLYLGLA